MANYDIEEDPKELRLQLSMDMLELHRGMEELEAMCDENFSNFLEKLLDK